MQQTLVPNSPIVMGPVHVPMITSLDMTWDFHLWSSSQKPIIASHNRRRFTETLDLLPRAFPCLHWLYIAFTGNLVEVTNQRINSYPTVDEVEKIMLQPLLQATKSMSQAKHIRFALPSSMVLAIRTAAERCKKDKNGAIKPEYADWFEKRTAKYNKFRWCGFYEWYPFGVDESQEGHAGEGFWVAMGPEPISTTIGYADVSW